MRQVRPANRTYSLTYGPERKVYTLTETEPLSKDRAIVGIAGKCQERDNEWRAFRFDRFANIDDRIKNIVDIDIHMERDACDCYLQGGNIDGRPLTDSEMDNINSRFHDWVQELAWNKADGNLNS